MGHPELEELAAFLDRRLDRGERERVVAHLAGCEECYEVFVETARLRDEVAAAEVGEVTAFPFEERKGLRRRFLAAAAAAAVAACAAGFFIYRERFAKPDLPLSEMVASLPAGQDPRLAAWGEQSMRGGEEPAGELTPGSFLFGVLEMDLAWRLAAGDWQGAAELSRRIANLLAEASFSKDDTASFRDLASALRSGSPPADVLETTIEALEAAELSFSPAHVKLGRWAEAGRLSALAREPAFFETRENRRFLEILLHEPEALRDLNEGEEVVLDPEVRGELATLEAIWSGRRGGALDYLALEAAFTRIIDFYDRQLRR